MEKTVSNYDLEKELNYSNCTPNKIVEIEQQIGDDGYIIRLINKAMQGETVLGIAPTGSGKTYSVINGLKQMETLKAISNITCLKSIFIVPNAIQVSQIMNDPKYAIPGAYDKIPVLEELEKGNIIAMTWDKFIQIPNETLEECIIVLDEVHQTYIDMFRLPKISQLYDRLQYVRGQLHLTATPFGINLDKYDYIVEYQVKETTDYDVKVYDKICDTKILNIINNSKKCVVFRDDTKYLKSLKKAVTNKRVEVVNRDDSKKSKAYNEIVKHSTMKCCDILATTSIIVAGVNIYDPNVTDIILINEKHKNSIMQKVARVRNLKNVRVHIFNTFKEEEFNVYEIDWRVKVEIHKNKILCEQLNEGVQRLKDSPKEYKREISYDPFNITTNDCIYWCDKTRLYYINEQAIYNKCVVSYYNKADIVTFKAALQEYFPNIEIVFLDKKKNEMFEQVKKDLEIEEKEALEILEPNKDLLVGAIDILADDIDNRLAQHLYDHDLTYTIKKQLIDLEMDKYISVGKVSKILNSYKKLVLENSYNYEIAWNLANTSDKQFKRFHGQLRNLTHREIENKYPGRFEFETMNEKIYEFIMQNIKPGMSWTKDIMDLLIETINNRIPGANMNTTKMGEMLNRIFNIEDKQYRINKKNVTQFTLLLEKNITELCDKNKRVRIYTAKNYLTLEDICQQHNICDDNSIKMLRLQLDNRFDKLTEPIRQEENLAFGEDYDWYYDNLVANQ